MELGKFWWVDDQELREGEEEEEKLSPGLDVTDDNEGERMEKPIDEDEETVSDGLSTLGDSDDDLFFPNNSLSPQDWWVIEDKRATLFLSQLFSQSQEKEWEQHAARETGEGRRFQVYRSSNSSYDSQFSLNLCPVECSLEEREEAETRSGMSRGEEKELFGNSSKCCSRWI